MRTPEEIKSDLEKAQLELKEARKQYKAIIAPGDNLRPVKLKDIRPVHNKLAKARDLVRDLERKLRKAEK